MAEWVLLERRGLPSGAAQVVVRIIGGPKLVVSIPRAQSDAQGQMEAIQAAVDTHPERKVLK